MLFSLLALLPFAFAAPAMSPANPLAARGQTFNGRATFYLIADSDPHLYCGDMYTDENEPLVALDKSQMNQGLCHKWITVTYNGATTRAQVKDQCDTCSYGDVDLSPGAMSNLRPDWHEVGQFQVSWTFDDDGGGGGDQPSDTPSPTPSPTPEPTTSSDEPSPTPSPSPTSSDDPQTSTSTSTTDSSSSSSSSSSDSSSSSSTTTASSSVASFLSSSASSSALSSSALPFLSSSATFSSISVPVPTSLSITNGTGLPEGGNLSNMMGVLANFGFIVLHGASGP